MHRRWLGPLPQGPGACQPSYGKSGLYTHGSPVKRRTAATRWPPSALDVGPGAGNSPGRGSGGVRAGYQRSRWTTSPNGRLWAAGSAPAGGPPGSRTRPGTRRTGPREAEQLPRERGGQCRGGGSRGPAAPTELTAPAAVAVPAAATLPGPGGGCPPGAGRRPLPAVGPRAPAPPERPHPGDHRPRGSPGAAPPTALVALTAPAPPLHGEPVLSPDGGARA